MQGFSETDKNSTNFPTESYGTSNNSANFVTPYKLQTGVMRGTQTIASTDGSKVVLGQIPNSTDFGIAFYDKDGNLISKQIGNTTYEYDSLGNLTSKTDNSTRYVYDGSGKNIIQEGKLPDGSYGLVVAKPGTDVSALFS